MQTCRKTDAVSLSFYLDCVVAFTYSKFALHRNVSTSSNVIIYKLKSCLRNGWKMGYGWKNLYLNCKKILITNKLIEEYEDLCLFNPVRKISRSVIPIF